MMQVEWPFLPPSLLILWQRLRFGHASIPVKIWLLNVWFAPWPEHFRPRYAGPDRRSDTQSYVLRSPTPLLAWFANFDASVPSTSHRPTPPSSGERGPACRNILF